MLIVYAALIFLPLVGLARGELKTYHPLQLALPTMSIFYCFNIFSKLAVGALSGFEYVAILAGETRAPARDIGRSVLIASPVIALAFILGTSSVLAFVGKALGPEPIQPELFVELAGQPAGAPLAGPMQFHAVQMHLHAEASGVFGQRPVRRKEGQG